MKAHGSNLLDNRLMHWDFLELFSYNAFFGLYAQYFLSSLEVCGVTKRYSGSCLLRHGICRVVIFLGLNVFSKENLTVFIEIEGIYCHDIPRAVSCGEPTSW